MTEEIDVNIIVANEGNAIALAVGLSVDRKICAVYMQNSD